MSAMQVRILYGVLRAAQAALMPWSVEMDNDAECGEDVVGITR